MAYRRMATVWGLLVGCGGAEPPPASGATPPPEQPRAHRAADGGCVAGELSRVVSTVSDASPEVRLNLLVAGLKASCSTLEPGLLAWVAGLDDPGVSEEVAAYRQARCPTGDALWTGPIEDWSTWTAQVWDRCDLASPGLLTVEEGARGGGPEAALLGMALYEALASADGDAARTLGRWVAGHPPDAGKHLARDRYGAFGHGGSFPVGAARATRRPSRRCAPLLTVTPQAMAVDGVSLAPDGLSAALQPCRDLVPFRGVLALMTPPDTTFRRLMEALEPAHRAGYQEAEWVVRRGASTAEAELPDPAEAMASVSFVWTLPSAVAPSGEAATEAAPAPRKVSKGKAAARPFAGGGLLGAAPPAASSPPQVRLTRDGFRMVRGTSGVSEGLVSELGAVLDGLEASGEVLELQVDAEVPARLLLEALDQVHGPGDAQGRPTGRFPFVTLSLAGDG